MAKALTTTERRERYEALVETAERLITEQPGAYRRRLALLALLGYGVVFGVLFALLALIIGSVLGAMASTVFLLVLVKKKLIIVLAVLAWVLAKALWVRFSPPAGLALERAAAPRLHEELDGLRATLDVPTIHQVLLTDDFNAGVVQTPRLGVLGWQKNSLLLGLPLLLALSPEEARAVVAHELGHLSRNHSRFNAWIYRVRATWYRIMAAFDDAEGWAVGWLRRFFNWYAPYFNAMSFALARANEYEADAVAVSLTSSPAAAAALVGTTVRDQIAGSDYWATLIARADSEPDPEARPYRGLMRFHETHEPDSEVLRRSLREALQRETDHSDTHPALKDRLGAIGEQPRAAFRVATSAARDWLGECLDEILDRFDRDWLERNAEPWRERFRAQREERARLQELNARDRDGLEPLELWELAALTEQHEGADGALALFRDYQQREPDDPDAHFVIGRILLSRDDAGGVTAMERAAQHFPLARRACEHLYGFYQRTGEPDRAEQWRLRGEAHIDLENRARAERAAVTSKDRFEPSGLDAAALAALRDQLTDRKDVKHAWIARKQVAVLPEAPLYVLAFSPRGWFRNADKATAALAEALDFPGEAFVVPTSGEGAKVAKRVRKAGEVVL